MPSNKKQHISKDIIKKARKLGASQAGLVSVASIRDSPSHRAYREIQLSSEANSVVVLALMHDQTDPQLDWWDGKHGTEGNRILINIGKDLARWLAQKYGITARDLAYQVDEGGIFLKDAAVSAGLGALGKNNLLITPDFGPRVRLRAFSIDADVEPTGPIDFAPCETCDMPCRQTCPQGAFQSGSYDRSLCNEQMEHDKENALTSNEADYVNSSGILIKYCRVCEFACPVARKEEKKKNQVSI
jgi:epoxyqueuosine reductase